MILIAGPYRTGSTWLFNAVRLTLIHANREVYGASIHRYDPQRKEHNHIIKLVKYDPRLAQSATHVFTSFRNVYDTIDSMRRRAVIAEPGFINETLHQNITDHILHLLNWEKHSNFRLWFPDIYDRPEWVIKQIAHHLNVKADPRAVNTAINNLTIPETGYDPVSLLHAGHITKPKK